MEESEKRRERLRAMRMEAQAEVSSPHQTVSSSTLSSLSNPLLERTQDDSHAIAPRFGFYTDPMAAFSYEKRQTGHQPRAHIPPSPSGSLNLERPLSGVHQFQNSYSPHQNMQQHVDPYYNPGPSASPAGIRSPYVYQGSPVFNSPSGRGQDQWRNSSPSPGWGGGGSPYPMHQGSPVFNSPSGRGQDQRRNSSPNPGWGGGGSPYLLHQGNPNFRTSPPGRGHYSNNSPGPSLGRGGSPSPNMGRGRGRWDGNRMSPRPRYSGGRGRGSDFDGQGRSFYNKSMVEDPWESLTPVIWQGTIAPTFLQRTPVVKKARVESPFDNSNSSQSLAEFLAASFDEAVGNATTE